MFKQFSITSVEYEIKSSSLILIHALYNNVLQSSMEFFHMSFFRNRICCLEKTSHTRPFTIMLPIPSLYQHPCEQCKHHCMPWNHTRDMACLEVNLIWWNIKNWVVWYWPCVPCLWARMRDNRLAGMAMGKCSVIMCMYYSRPQLKLRLEIIVTDGQLHLH